MNRLHTKSLRSTSAVGSHEENGTWSGVMGAVYRGEVDTVADIFIIEEASANAFLWSEPVTCVGLCSIAFVQSTLLQIR